VGTYENSEMGHADVRKFVKLTLSKDDSLALHRLGWFWQNTSDCLPL